MKHILWLASYPKSGSTWIRVLLTAYRQVRLGGSSLDLNRLDGGPIASSREMFDYLSGLPSSDLTAGEIEELRPEVYRARAAQAGAPLVTKVHDMFARTASGRWLFPPEVSRAVLYVVRHPGDVALSLAAHSGIPVERAVERLCDPAHLLAASHGKLDPQLQQRLGTWSDHVASWTAQTEVPATVIRYEDLQREPAMGLRTLLTLLGETPVDEAVTRAVALSAFPALQALEQARGFRERPATATAPFFREGKSGGWRRALSPVEQERLEQALGAMMQRCGYEST